MNLKHFKQILIGLTALLTLSGAMAQDWKGLKAGDRRVGHNAQSNLVNPGRAFLRWFRPNITDNVGGSVVIDNDAGLPGITFLGPWQFPLTRQQEAFFAFFIDPNTPAAYHYMRTIPSALGG